MAPRAHSASVRSSAADVADPFRITGPAVISFSGGRTSGYMLHRILQAHGGTLPADVVVCFANTGREMPATLDFVRDCGAAWSVPIKWLEYRREGVVGKLRQRVFAEEVSHNSAARNGEPFDALLTAKGLVPDPFRRFCTVELKIRTVQRWIKAELFWRKWANVVGLRADEMSRVQKKAAADIKAKAPYVSVMPLADAGIEKIDVLRFWRDQPFDLELKGEHEGNCDGCFVKTKSALSRMFQDYPDRMDWWTRKESEGGSKTFVVGRSFASIANLTLAQGVIPFSIDDPMMKLPCELSGCGA